MSTPRPCPCCSGTNLANHCQKTGLGNLLRWNLCGWLTCPCGAFIRVSDFHHTAKAHNDQCKTQGAKT